MRLALPKFSSAFAFLLLAACTQGHKEQESRVTNNEIKLEKTAGTRPGVSTADTSSGRLTDIKNGFARITTLLKNGELDSAGFNYSCQDEKKGQVSYFSEDGTLKLIIHRFSEYDHYSAEHRFYIAADKAFFVFQRDESWAFVSGAEGSTKDNIVERRIYLADGKAIETLERRYSILRTTGKRDTSAIGSDKKRAYKDTRQLEEEYQR